GTDLIIGHHAHIIQSFEEYRGKHIFYGLGNCVFPPHQSPSYFSTDGLTSRKVDSRPGPHNRKSLAVNWDPVSGKVEAQPLYFDDNKVIPGRFAVNRHHLSLKSLEGYEERYKRVYHRGKLNHTIRRFLSRPKLPTIDHFRSVRALFRSSPPK